MWWFRFKIAYCFNYKVRHIEGVLQAYTYADALQKITDEYDDDCIDAVELLDRLHGAGSVLELPFLDEKENTDDLKQEEEQND